MLRDELADGRELEWLGPAEDQPRLMETRGDRREFGQPQQVDEHVGHARNDTGAAMASTRTGSVLRRRVRRASNPHNPANAAANTPDGSGTAWANSAGLPANA